MTTDKYTATSPTAGSPRPESAVFDDGGPEELPAYSPSEAGSGVLVPEYVAGSNGSAPPPPAATGTASAGYLTADREKAQRREAEEVAAVAAAAAAMIDPPAPSTTTTSAHGAMPMPTPTPTPAGHASATTLARGLHVPTASQFVSSGFPYPDVLASYAISASDWARFTAEITQAAQMKAGDWALAVGGGTGTLLVAGLVIGWWGIIPAYLVGRNIHRKRELGNLAAARATGPLERTLLQWNQDVFAPKGILIRLDLPGEGGRELADMDVHMRARSAAAAACRQRGQDATAAAAALSGLVVPEKQLAKMQRKMAKKERKMDKCARKLVTMEAKAKKRAIKKGRIVILPLHKGAPAPAAAAAAADHLPPLARLTISEKVDAHRDAASMV
ncbi:MAG: hypothetical protein M1826_001276 [Phylliscum demangeonii]|nr:MAG: hypothetical protein M1826_001276 [Phylliscum demangeonii]